MAFPDKNAIAWRTESIGREAFTLSGSVEILYGTNPQMNVLLARRDAGFVSVAFRAGSGVTIFDYRKAGEEWRRVGWYDAPEVQVGREFPFSVRVDGRRITVAVSDQEPLSWTLDEDVDVRGAWGVGAQYASAGIWRGVTLE